jgi:predicted nucleic acid-binding protein
MKVICDTNVFIRLFSQDPDTAAELTKIGSQNVLFPSVSLMELIAGMQDKKEMKELQKKIKNYKGAFQIVASKAEVRSAHIYSPEQTSGLHICDNLKCTQLQHLAYQSPRLLESNQLDA